MVQHDNVQYEEDGMLFDGPAVFPCCKSPVPGGTVRSWQGDMVGAGYECRKCEVRSDYLLMVDSASSYVGDLSDMTPADLERFWSGKWWDSF